MDFLPDLATLSDWLVNYGSFFLFFLLALGIVAFPVPEETMMIVAGALMGHQKLPIGATYIAALAGSMFGITMSYLIGRTAGTYVITKYGKWVGITHARMVKAHEWFEHYGKWALFVGYFIPGVRHFTGLTAGITELHPKQFMLFAYSGALVWVSMFLSIGYFFGHYALTIYEEWEFTFDEAIIIALSAGVLLLIGTVIYVKRRQR